VKFFNSDLAKLTLFSINTAHTDEHWEHGDLFATQGNCAADK
jgi:hypothetical protein